jgi:hypothetical protein
MASSFVKKDRALDDDRIDLRQARRRAGTRIK